MYCKNCGASIDDNAAFCPNCGAANAPQQNYSQPQQPQQGYGQPQQSFNQPNYAYQNGGYYNPQQQPFPPGAQKSKLAAGLLGIFLGSLGVHNFYLGYTGKAVAQLLISLLTCGIGVIGTSIWGLVEGILILTGSINVDANGVPLGE